MRAAAVMDQTDWLDPRAPRNDFLIGFGGSLLIHLGIVLVVTLTPMLVQTRTVSLPSYQVKLVSSAELGPEPGEAGAKAAAGKSASPPRSKAQITRPKVEKNPPIMPVKRLQPADKPAAKVSLSKVESTAKVPAIEAKPPAVEKHLDELLPKAAAGKPPPKPVSRQSAPNDEEMKALDAMTDPGKPVPAKSGTGKGTGKGAGQGADGSGTAGGSGSAASSGTSGPPGPSGSGNGEQVGLAQKLYYTEVWNAIRSRWALPTVLRSSSLEAVIILVIQRDGQILESRFEKRSGNEAFDDSAMRAVKKANPLPPFPEIYSPRQAEIGVRFRPRDLS